MARLTKRMMRLREQELKLSKQKAREKARNNKSVAKQKREANKLKSRALDIKEKELRHKIKTGSNKTASSSSIGSREFKGVSNAEIEAAMGFAFDGFVKIAYNTFFRKDRSVRKGRAIGLAIFLGFVTLNASFQVIKVGGINPHQSNQQMIEEILDSHQK